MKPKENGKVGTYDDCQTPPEGIQPIMDLLHRAKLKFHAAYGFDEEFTIWEPAEGNGNLTGILWAEGFEVISTDIKVGINFLNFEPFQDRYHVIVTNPPYSNPLKFEFIERCYQLGKPWALLMPVETLGAARAQKSFKTYGVEVTFLKRRINFEMPNKGYSGGGAQFPTAWFTWHLSDKPIRFVDYVQKKR